MDKGYRGGIKGFRNLGGLKNFRDCVNFYEFVCLTQLCTYVLVNCKNSVGGLMSKTTLAIFP